MLLLEFLNRKRLKVYKEQIFSMARNLAKIWCLQQKKQRNRRLRINNNNLKTYDKMQINLNRYPKPKPMKI